MSALVIGPFSARSPRMDPDMPAALSAIRAFVASDGAVSSARKAIWAARNSSIRLSSAAISSVISARVILVEFLALHWAAKVEDLFHSIFKLGDASFQGENIASNIPCSFEFFLIQVWSNTKWELRQLWPA